MCNNSIRSVGNKCQTVSTLLTLGAQGLDDISRLLLRSIEYRTVLYNGFPGSENRKAFFFLSDSKYDRVELDP